MACKHERAGLVNGIWKCWTCGHVLPVITLPPEADMGAMIRCINGVGCKLYEIEEKYKQKISRLEAHLKSLSKDKREISQFASQLVEELKNRGGCA